jgi:hypothetical protein
MQAAAAAALAAGGMLCRTVCYLMLWKHLLQFGQLHSISYHDDLQSYSAALLAGAVVRRLCAVLQPRCHAVVALQAAVMQLV